MGLGCTSKRMPRVTWWLVGFSYYLDCGRRCCEKMRIPLGKFFFGSVGTERNCVKKVMWQVHRINLTRKWLS